MSTDQRFFIDKPSGSDRACVYDRKTGLLMQRFNIFKTYSGLDGWAAADRYCERMNERAAVAITKESRDDRS